MASFDKVSERTARLIAGPWFFAAVVLAIAAWLPTVALWDTGASDLLVDALTNPMSLLLLVLLQNSHYRSGLAQDDRQDEIERSLAMVLRHLADSEGDEGRRRELVEGARRLVRNAERSRSISSADVADGHS